MSLLKYGYCGYVKQPFVDRMVLTNGIVLPIDDAYDFAFTGSAATGHTFVSNGNSVTAPKVDIAEVHVRIPVYDVIPDNFCRRLFQGYTGATDIDLEFEDKASGPIEAGTYAFSAMFQDSNIIFPVDSKFTIPPRIIKCTGTFCSDTFLSATINSLPNGFTLPLMTDTGDGYCSSMFDSSNISKLPNGFTVSHLIVNHGEQFCYKMFDRTPIAGLPSSFKMPQGNTASSNVGYCSLMFRNCYSLTQGSGSGVDLYFTFDATNCFQGTTVTPATPLAGSTVTITLTT